MPILDVGLTTANFTTSAEKSYSFTLNKFSKKSILPQCKGLWGI